MKTVSISFSVTDEQHNALDAERVRFNAANASNDDVAPVTDAAQFVGMMCASQMRSRADALLARNPEQVRVDEVHAENQRLRDENEKLRSEKAPTR